MNDRSHPWRESVSPSLLERVDKICDQFEDAWMKAGSPDQRPPIEDFVRNAPESEQALLFYELIVLDVNYRQRQGQKPQAEDYVARFPSLDLAPLGDVFAEPASLLSASGAQTADSSPAVGPPRTQATRIRCPHCHNPIQLVDDRSDEVLCPGCGSSFRIREARQTTTTEPMRRLGKFQLLERVGLGAFGAVWKARDTELDRIVALKIPHTGSLTSETDLERFHREARAAAQLRHPGIVIVHEVQTLEELPTIVSDFIQGVTLKDYLEIRRLTFREAAQLIADVAEAADYAHSMGLVHRDLKPANVMLESVVRRPSSVAKEAEQAATDYGLRTTDQFKPLVMDFGLALRDEAEITMTLDGHIIGTPAYMSPEQAAGKGHQADRRSDVYSLGVILYELLTGELPFRGSKMMILHQVLQEEPRPPRKVNDKIPRDLETICLKALAKAPVRRYAAARQLAEDLRRFLNGEPIQARPVRQVERLWRWCRRNPWLAAASSAVAIALVAAAVSGSLAALAAQEAAKKNQELALQSSRAALAAQDAASKDRELLFQSLVGQARAERLAGNRWRSLELLAQASAMKREDQLRQEAIQTLMSSGLRLVKEVRGGHLDQIIISPDSNMLATWDTVDHNPVARVIEIPSGKVLHEPVDPRRPLAFRPATIQLVVQNSSDRTRLWIWEPLTGKDLGPFEGEQPVFSPDGVLLATAGKDGVKIHDLAKHKVVNILSKEKPLAFLSNHELLLGSDLRQRIWDVSTAREAFVFDGALLAVSADGRMAAARNPGKDKDAVVLWDLGLRRQIGPVSNPELLWLMFSPDGKRLAFGKRESELTINVADVKDSSFNNRLSCRAMSSWSYGVARDSRSFAPDGTLFAAMGVRGGRTALCMWEVESGVEWPVLPEIYGFRWSRDGRLLITNGPSGTGESTLGSFRYKFGDQSITGEYGYVRFWEVAHPSPTYLVDAPIESLSFDREGSRLAANDVIWEVVNRGQGPILRRSARTKIGSRPVFLRDGDVWIVDKLPTSEDELEAIMLQRVEPEGQRIALHNPGYTDKRLLHDETHLRRGSRPVPQAIRVAFSPGTSLLLVCNQINWVSKDGAIGDFGLKSLELWDRLKQKRIAIWASAEGEDIFSPLQFSPDGKHAAVGGDGLKIWDVASGKVVRTLIATRVIQLAFSSDGARILAATDGKPAKVYGVVFTGRETDLAAANGLRISLFDVMSGKELQTWMSDKGGWTSFAQSPDGQWVASGSADGLIRIWDIAGGLELARWQAHDATVTAMAFNQDGKALVSGGGDGTLRLWNLPYMRKELAALGLDW